MRRDGIIAIVPGSLAKFLPRLAVVIRDIPEVTLYLKLRRNTLLAVSTVITVSAHFPAVNKQPFTVNSPVIFTVRILPDADLRCDSILAIPAIIQEYDLPGDKLHRVALATGQLIHAHNAILLLNGLHYRLKRCQVCVHVLALLLKSLHTRLKVFDVRLHLRVVILVTSQQTGQDGENT